MLDVGAAKAIAQNKQRRVRTIGQPCPNRSGLRPNRRTRQNVLPGLLPAKRPGAPTCCRRASQRRQDARLDESIRAVVDQKNAADRFTAIQLRSRVAGIAAVGFMVETEQTDVLKGTGRFFGDEEAGKTAQQGRVKQDHAGGQDSRQDTPPERESACVSPSFVGVLVGQQAEQVLAVAVVESVGQPFQLARVDETLIVGDFLKASDFQPLTFFDRPHKIGRLEQRRLGARVEPCETASQLLDVKLAAFHIGAIDISDFQFAPRRRF